MTRRPLIGVGAVVIAVTIVLATQLGPGTGRQAADASADPSGATPTVPIGSTARPTIRPVPGHELFGFVPYWEMDDGIAEHLAETPLTTLALFSVTHTKTGTLDTGQTGYKRITGADRASSSSARRTTAEIAVELTYTSFGPARNERLFGSTERPGRDDRLARRPRRRDRCRRHQRRRRADRPRPRAGLWRVRRAAARGAPGGDARRRRSRSPRPAGRTGAAMAAAAAAPPAPTGSS